MNKNTIQYTVIVLLAMTAGFYVLRHNAKSRKQDIASAPPLVKTYFGEQKTAASPIVPVIEPPIWQADSTDDKKTRNVRSFVTSDEIPREEYSLIIARSNVRTFGKAIKGLGLSPEGQVKLMELLNERGEVYRDLRAVVADNPRMPMNEYQAAAAQAYATVDLEIESAFGAEKYAQIKDMIGTSAYLVQINEAYDAYLTAAGQPLAPEQILTVAMVMAKGYGKPGSAHTMPNPSNVDGESGLTLADRTVLNQLTPVLNSEQLRLFQQVLVTRNAEFLRIQRSRNNPNT